MKRIDSLEGLRLILFIGIFLFHLTLFQGVGETFLYKKFIKGMGSLSVSLFFIISGFVAELSWEKHNRGGIIGQIKTQINKIYPIHWICLLFVMPITFKFNIKHIIKLIINALLLQSWIPIRAIWLSYNSVAWYLSALVFLRVITPKLHIIIQKIPINKCKIYIFFLWLTQLFLACICICLCLPYNFVAAVLYANPLIRALDYIIGMLCAYLYLVKGVKQKGRKYEMLDSFFEVLLLVLVYLFLMMYDYVPYSFQWAAFFMPLSIFVLFVTITSKGFIVSKILSSRIFVFGGGYTFYLFMIHQVVLRYMSAVHNHWDLDKKVCILLSFVISFLAAVFLKKLDLFLKEYRNRMRQKNE